LSLCLGENNSQASLCAFDANDGASDKLLATYALSTLSTESFPDVPSVKGTVFTIKRSEFLKGLRSVIFAASTDLYKEVLTGVNLQIEGQSLEFCATDGHRLAYAKINSDDAFSSTSLNVTIPALALRELERILGKYEPETVSLILDQNLAEFQISELDLQIRIISHLLSGKYPPYHQLFPKEFLREMYISRQKLTESVERLLTIAGQRSLIKFLTRHDQYNSQVTLTTEEEQVGSGQENLEVKIIAAIGDKATFAVNGKYLLSIINAVKDDTVAIRFNSSTAPIVITPNSEDPKFKSLAILMPIQLNNPSSYPPPEPTDSEM